MFANTLLTFYRVTVRHPRYAALNLLGLSFGIAVFLTLGLYVRFETGFESWIPDSGRLYYAATKWTLPGRPDQLDMSSMGALLDELHEDYPDLRGARAWQLDASVRKGDEAFHEQEELVDPDLLDILDLPLVEGDKRTALSGPGRIMITAAMAEKYFGHGPALGKTIRLTDLEGEGSYEVSAVLANLPRDTELQFDFVRVLTPRAIKAYPYWAHWGSATVSTYLHFDRPDQAARFEAGMDGFVDRKAGPIRGTIPYHTIETIRLVKVPDQHLHEPQARAAVVTLGLVGLLSLGIAAINFVNLATARAGSRAREVAVRRALGATRGALMAQFLLEAVATSLVASLIALSLVELTLPLINAAGGLNLTLDYRSETPFLLELLAGVLVTGLLAGLYPAAVLSGFQPAQVLASSRSPAGGRFGIRVREALVVVQFAVVIAFLIMSWGFVRQLAHMKTADLGFRREGLLVSASTRDPAMTGAEMQSVWAALRSVPGVVAVGSGDSAPGADDYQSYQNVSPPGGDQEVNVGWSRVGPGFFEAYRATLLAGRFVDQSHPADDIHDSKEENAPRQIVINERAAEQFGFHSPGEAIGQTLHSGHQPLTVVGVIGDLQFLSPSSERVGMFYVFDSQPTAYQITAVRYAGVPESVMRERLAAAWRSVAPGFPFDVASTAESLDKYYKPDRNRSHLFDIGAAVAALVGCIGLYGMAAFSTSRRMLEVAVRKVLGASRGAVVRLLVGQFLRPVLLANLIAWPIGYVLLRDWLMQFNDHIAITPVPFLVGGGAALLVAVVTVAALAIGSANAEPGRALRYE